MDLGVVADVDREARMEGESPDPGGVRVAAGEGTQLAGERLIQAIRAVSAAEASVTRP